jgi:precorrin-2/cobalt-factor-2 C20-methyltransferase
VTDAPARARQPRLIGVGVGPGDPELLTLRAVRVIQEADLIFAPTRRAGGRSMALEIAAAHLDSSRQRVEIVPFPESRDGESWDTEARNILAALGDAGQGAFLTEGDPMLFGSFGRLMTALRKLRPGLLIEIVPGVSSVTAAAAAAGVELTDYNDRLAIVPATTTLTEVDDALRQFDCVVILKIGSVLGDLLRLLEQHKLLDQAVYVQRCGWPDQRIVHDLRQLLADPPRDYFALLIVRRRY